MGRLSDLQILKTSIETPGGEFAVRGLSFEDIVNLYNEHTGQASELFDQFQKWASAEEDDAAMPPVSEFVALMVSQAPILVGRVIAKAADEDTPEGLAMARRLPPLVQAEALGAIGRLTFRSEDDVKKMAALLIRYAQNLVRALIRGVGDSTTASAGSSGLFDPE